MAIVNTIMIFSSDGPRYVTVCMKKHWGREGCMVTTSTWDATKFDIEDKDAQLFCDYLNSKYPDEHYEIVPIDERHLARTRNEYWSDANVHTTFKDDHVFQGVVLK